MTTKLSGHKWIVREVFSRPEDKNGWQWMINTPFCICQVEDKTSALGTAQLGYLGVHYLVAIRPDQVTDDNSTIAELICEVQVNTQAQRLWADLAHDLSYKRIQEGIGPSERMINRLVALVEIFDSESSRAKEVIEAQPGFEEAMVLSALEQSYFQLTGKTFNREFSLDIIRRLLPTLTEDELARFSPRMEEFVAHNLQKLEKIFADYEDDERSSPLLFQPESLLIFERIQETPYVLKDQWAESLPLALLEDLGVVWGKPI